MLLCAQASWDGQFRRLCCWSLVFCLRGQSPQCTHWMSVSAYVCWDGCRHVLRATWTNIAQTLSTRASSASRCKIRPSSSTFLGLHLHRRRLHLQNLQHPRVSARSVFPCSAIAAHRLGGGCLAFPCLRVVLQLQLATVDQRRCKEGCRCSFWTAHGEVQAEHTLCT